MVLHAAAALAVATSPSGLANLCAPVGATIIGDGILYPNKLVDMSILLTSIRTRGRNRILPYAAIFSLSVYSSSAPPLI